MLFALLNGRRHQKEESHSFQTKKSASKNNFFWLSSGCSKLRYSEGPKNANLSVGESGVPSDVRVAHLAFLGEIVKHTV